MQGSLFKDNPWPYKRHIGYAKDIEHVCTLISASVADKTQYRICFQCVRFPTLISFFVVAILYILAVITFIGVDIYTKK